MIFDIGLIFITIYVCRLQSKCSQCLLRTHWTCSSHGIATLVLAAPVVVLVSSISAVCAKPKCSHSSGEHLQFLRLHHSQPLVLQLPLQLAVAPHGRAEHKRRTIVHVPMAAVALPPPSVLPFWEKPTRFARRTKLTGKRPIWVGVLGFLVMSVC